jgi:hypothetical protein
MNLRLPPPITAAGCCDIENRVHGLIIILLLYHYIIINQYGSHTYRRRCF